MKCEEYTFCQLAEREVINVVDGQKLGKINDMVFSENGKICGFVVPGVKQFIKSLSGKENIFVPWCCVLKFGNDVILVDLNAQKREVPGLNP